MKRLITLVTAVMLSASPCLADGVAVSGLSKDVSGTVTNGGVYQVVSVANSLRKNCTVQNPTTASEVLNVKIGAMANPYTLTAGTSVSSNSGQVTATDTITVTAATTGHAFAGTCQ
jgi:hypothetical protein